ncbi:hypothetical protein [Chryseobacterium sp. MA9]|uniref:hypothetical protein n=1 Tax=Chryseobacterium sp. MA9 TaxID=2966625 RepID=UPI0021057D58|nr:hypothetical protein [Chryseobacterium sp. MA9]UTX46910.1 hypothetical protein KIK00_13195 [Chryseobacterium sp. MA9]
MRKIILSSLLGLSVLGLFSCSSESDITNDIKQSDLQNPHKERVFSKAMLSPNDDPRRDGAFIKNYDNGKVYIKFEGQLRHVMSLQTLEGLFKRREIEIFPANSQSLLTSANATMGEPIGPDNELINHVLTGKVYFREGNIIRHIPTMSILNRYRFDLGNVRHVSDISNYTEHQPIFITY